MNDIGEAIKTLAPGGEVSLYDDKTGKYLVLPDRNEITRQIEEAETPERLVDYSGILSGMIETAERTMRYSREEIRPLAEGIIIARWKLGQMLAGVERLQGAPLSRVGTRFRAVLDKIRFNKNRALEAQRIALLPREDLDKILAKPKLPSFEDLVRIAKPLWAKESKQKRHKQIAEKAEAQRLPDSLGPFPLLYLDPPWTFETFAPSGQDSDRAAGQHYPVMSDDEILLYRVGGISVSALAAKDACMFMWCTSTNILRAIRIMTSWGFEYKTQAVWVKDRIGTGYIFRNQHEVLLYGSRGEVPAPVYAPPSVFTYPRAEHSAKPPEVRRAIEEMFPHFDESTRCELFARGSVARWTCVGFEA